MRITLLPTSRLQSKYLLTLLLAMLVPAFLTGYFVYYFIFNLTAEQLSMPEMIHGTLVPVLEQINMLILLSFVPFFLLVYLLGLYLSSRLCGPLKRIERDLDEVVKGNYQIHFYVRKNDEIKGIVEKINRVMEIIRTKSK